MIEVADPALSRRTPKVSVACITYMQERFVEEALRSVFAQQTAFSFELVVGDDFSTDGTRAVLQRWQSAHPDKVRLLMQERNIGVGGNLATTLRACRGEYIAFLEGDDYWSFSGKLERQVGYLDSNPAASACVHNVCILGVDGSISMFPVRYSSPGATVEEILRKGPAHTSSIMLRREVLAGLPRPMLALPMGDWPLLVACAVKGRVAFLDEDSWSTYRLQGQGSWTTSTLLSRTRGEMEALDAFGRFLGRAYDEVIQSEKNRRELRLVFGYLDLGRVAEAGKAYGRFLRRWPRFRSVSTRMVLGALRLLCRRSIEKLLVRRAR